MRVSRYVVSRKYETNSLAHLNNSGLRDVENIIFESCIFQSNRYNDYANLGVQEL